MLYSLNSNDRRSDIITVEDLPKIPELLKDKLKLKNTSEGLKMIYVNNWLVRGGVICGLPILLLLCIYVIKVGFIDPVFAILIVLVPLAMLFILIETYSKLFKCSIIFNGRYIKYTDFTFYPVTKILRRFHGHYLETEEMVTVVRQNHSTYHYNIVRIESKYHLIEIQHKDSDCAKEHLKIIRECLEYTKVKDD